MHAGFASRRTRSGGIRQAVGRAVADKSRLVRMPAQAFGDQSRVSTAERELTQRLGRVPTAREIATAAALSERRVARAADWRVTPAPLDLVGDDDLFAAAGDDAEVDLAGLRRDLGHQLAFLDEQTQAVLALRFGLRGGGERSVGEVASRLGLAVDKIAAIEAQALADLRVRCLRRMKEYAA